MTSIVFAGIGGQGVITVSNIVGRAAVIEGKNAMMTELHGMAQRGGRISVDLRIGDYRNAIIPNGSADVIVAF
ncbi:MAG: 2-oxoacid:acceptor oxidoreductase family protein, partial [Thermoplasmata archaeon]